MVRELKDRLQVYTARTRPCMGREHGHVDGREHGRVWAGRGWFSRIRLESCPRFNGINRNFTLLQIP